MLVGKRPSGGNRARDVAEQDHPDCGFESRGDHGVVEDGGSRSRRPLSHNRTWSGRDRPPPAGSSRPGSWYFSTKCSPSMTTRSKRAPDLVSSGTRRSALGTAEEPARPEISQPLRASAISARRAAGQRPPHQTLSRTISALCDMNGPDGRRGERRPPPIGG